MKLRNLLTIFSLSLLLPACEFKCSVGDAKTDEKTKPIEKNGMALYNGIELEAKGLRVNKAYLVTNDDRAERIGEGNFIDLEKGVKLVLLIDGGWKGTDGRVWPGAAMKVNTDSGEKILEQEDLFAKFDEEGVSEKDAKIISLSVYLSKLKPNRPVSFDVFFRVWDKKGDGVIDGRYTVHTK